jgi:hypothetical protein
MWTSKKWTLRQNFEISGGARYEVILGMMWLKQVDAWITCKEWVVHGKLQNDNKILSEVRDLCQMFLHFRIYKWKDMVKNCHQVFLIHLSEIENETKDNESNTKGVKVFLMILKMYFLKSQMSYHLLERLTMLFPCLRHPPTLGHAPPTSTQYYMVLRLSLQVLRKHILVLLDIKCSSNWHQQLTSTIDINNWHGILACAPKVCCVWIPYPKFRRDQILLSRLPKIKMESWR